MKQNAERTISPAKLAFDDLIETGKNWLQWIECATELQAVVRSKILGTQLERETRSTIEKNLSVKIPEQQVLLNSLYVTMVAGFEEYLRATIKKITSNLSRSNPQYEQLNEEIRRLHIRETAKLLRRIDSPPDYLSLNEVDLCTHLGSCVPNSKKVILNTDALAEIESPIKMENFMDRATILGKSLSWDDFAKQQSVKMAINMPKDNTRSIAKALKDELTRISQYRNRIAHTGGTASDVTTELIKQHRSLLASISNAIESATH